MTRTSSRIPFCMASRISTGMRHQTAGRLSGTTVRLMPRWNAVRYRASPVPPISAASGDDRSAQGVLAWVPAVQPDHRRSGGLPGQQVEDQRDRDESGEDAGQLQGEVQPRAAGSQGADEQRLLLAERLRRGE